MDRIKRRHIFCAILVAGALAIPLLSQLDAIYLAAIIRVAVRVLIFAAIFAAFGFAVRAIRRVKRKEDKS